MRVQCRSDIPIIVGTVDAQVVTIFINFISLILRHYIYFILY